MVSYVPRLVSAFRFFNLVQTKTECVKGSLVQNFLETKFDLDWFQIFFFFLDGLISCVPTPKVTYCPLPFTSYAPYHGAVYQT